MNKLPIEFWPQLIERLGHRSPRFFQIIQKNAFLIGVIGALFPFLVTDLLPGVGVAVPVWLTYLNEKVIIVCSAVAGAGFGGLLVAKTTIQTPATPPLIDDYPKPTVEELAKEVADLKAKLNERPGL